MKAKRMLILVLSVILVLLTLPACSTNIGVTITQQKEDIIKCEEIQNCYCSDFIPDDEYELKSYNTIKEQINEENKEHIIYSNVEIRNQYFDITLSVKQEYSFYDKGGWILENCVVESVNEVTPINAPNKELVQEYIEEEIIIKYDFYDSVVCDYDNADYTLKYGDIIFGELQFDEMNTAKQLITYKSDVMNASGYYSFAFTETGWSIVNNEDDDLIKMKIESYTADYSQAYGSFVLDCAWAPLDPTHYTGELKVINIDNGYATYDLEFYLAREANLGITEGEGLIDEFNDFTGEIVIGKYLSGEDITLRYDSVKDCWTESMYSSFLRK